MARNISTRIRLQGTLVAETPLHVGGYGEDTDTDLPLACNGAGQWYVPGTSLAGALRQWCEEAFDNPQQKYGEGKQPTERGWGFQYDDRGHASRVVVEDAVIQQPESILVEIRDGVGIDRQWGAAAEHIKYDRAVLPRGTRLALCLTAEVEKREDRATALAMLTGLKNALEQREVRLGAAKTRGLGRIVLTSATLAEQTFNTRQGILEVVRDRSRGSAVSQGDIDAARETHRARRKPRIEITVRWQPVGSLMVKAGFDGIAVDMLPLTSAADGQIALALPGSSIKGAFRSQAERIVRTLLDRPLSGETDPKRKFLRHLELPLIDELFGLRGLSADDEKLRWPKGKPDHGPLPGLGALTVDDCYGTHRLAPRAWQQVQAAQSNAELRAALESAGLQPWAEAYHVAVDRWTGAAAESCLYTVLEPHRVQWEAMAFSIDLERLIRDCRMPVLALTILVLRDLAQGRLPLGFATHRGMGAVKVESINVTAHDTESPLDQLQAATLPNGCLDGMPAALRKELNAAWKAWISQHTPNLEGHT